MENALLALDWWQWISLAVGTWKHGALHRFVWVDGPACCEVEQVLKQYGIRCYGRGMQVEKTRRPDGTIDKKLRRWCYVNGRQAEWAEYMVYCLSTPLESAAVNPNNRYAWGMPLPKVRTQPATWADRLGDWMEGMLR